MSESTEAKHSPSPWKASKTLRSIHNRGIYTDGPFAWGVSVKPRNSKFGSKMRILRMEEPSIWRPEEEIKANVQLIEASPDLLEALDALVKWNESFKSFSDDTDFINSTLIDKATAAIEKATGGK